MWSAGASPAVLTALALVALLPSMPAILPAAYSKHATNGSCAILARRYNASLASGGERFVSVDGRAGSVTLVWGSAPARAASALLLVLLRDALHYRRVQLERGPHRTVDLAENVTMDSSIRYSDLVVGISTGWDPWEKQEEREWSPRTGRSCGLAGPRLQDMGRSPVPASRRLHARLAPRARESDSCRRHTHWTFYSNTTLLALCGFFDAFDASNGDDEDCAMKGVVYCVGDCSAVLSQLQRRVAAAALPLRTQTVDRAALAHYIRSANHSFLFLDYDFWSGESAVRVVEPPPCISTDSICHQELDPLIAMRVADVDILQTYAPHLIQVIYDFNPSPLSLRLILEQEGKATHIEEAACAWSLRHDRNMRQKVKKYNTLMHYDAMLFLCDGDPDNDNYTDILKLTGIHVYDQTRQMDFSIHVNRDYINCNNVYNLSIKMDELTRYVDVNRLVGVISVGTVGTDEAVAQASLHRLPLFLVDVPPEPLGFAAHPPSLPPPVWRVAGRPRHLALALQRFVCDSGWTRLAVLSQRTKLAADYYAAIQDGATFALRNYPIPMALSKLEVARSLQSLRNANARIVFVNADPEVASVILAAALKLRMSYADGFVWIFREWRPKSSVANTTLLTVSFWSRDKQGIPGGEGLQRLRTAMYRRYAGREWPARADALADTLLTLGAGLSDALRRHPELRQDLHSTQMMRALHESLKKPVKGINQLLHYKNQTIEENFVFVDKWRGDTFTRLAAWRVNVSEATLAAAVRGDYTRPADLPRNDGASRCFAVAGDPFEPQCYDLAWTSTLLVLALTPAALLLTRRVLRRRIARLLQAREIEVLARRQHVASTLTAYLVKREALELREELGSGRFGCVRLALLRLPAYATRYVAAKELRDNAAPAEESEFLREACTIASLDHEHVVRLVGVCIADGPPLVLMELAFFGDLLGYLRARRHLAEGAEGVDMETCASFEEAVHVSAEALTRLAREAAAALAYLGSRGVVHRDVRAANCLVDARRSLKLGDFGMARETVAGADGAPEYACRRRGLFPVLWMAPESLAHGVFSAATDVWALGMLVLELVTLGARPYGKMSPLRVLEYVAAGGRPPLPLDATPQTRGLARLCWQREAERRPSAAEVQAYLAARPRALGPALRIDCDEPADADSGFGESPSTELLPPDSPLDSLDQLDV